MEDKTKANFYLEHPLSQEEVQAMPPMSLAFIGDSVQSLYVRTRVTIGSEHKTGLLHKEVTNVVKAVSQADAVEKLLPLFNEVEADIFRRARNSKVQTSAKHADIAQYRYASGFEAVIGYLFMTGQTQRLSEFLDFAFESEIKWGNYGNIRKKFSKRSIKVQ